ncbi:GNAT family N-acetyltransferase [Paenibacillus sp. SAF-068]|uniref:GNAT family N-acetyltransferase n=1 Tax=Paenibacillus sp. SAF-068 TaxID=3436864 RepID=UPI003F7D869E
MEFITATVEHLPAIVQLLADDEFGITRERYEMPLPKEYIEAFAKIEQQIGNSLIVAIDNDVVVGCLQLTIIPGISRLGATRGQIEGVRVDKNYRSKGVGEELFRYAINQAKTLGCTLIQLTTDKQRKGAHKFYERLGFIASHDGMKLVLSK